MLRALGYLSQTQSRQTRSLASTNQGDRKTRQGLGIRVCHSGHHKACCKGDTSLSHQMAIGCLNLMSLSLTSKPG